MNIIQLIINIIELILIAYFGFAALYIFIFGFAGLFKVKTRNATSTKQRKYAVMIPGYKEDEVIVEVAKDALNQDYPKELL
jgi:cellulose synthase/poly-beta-1,6-N-acetylglucosamine synthase-like glycosyltransferase